MLAIPSAFGANWMWMELRLGSAGRQIFCQLSLRNNCIHAKYMGSMGRNKKSVAIDLRKEEGRE
jgi:crotonobetainyl-CoA:carnitine CoA-transferase CaiB-like acyl-CoA transferase